MFLAERGGEQFDEITERMYVHFSPCAGPTLGYIYTLCTSIMLDRRSKNAHRLLFVSGGGSEGGQRGSSPPLFKILSPVSSPNEVKRAFIVKEMRT